MECQNCPFNPVVKAIGALLDTRTVVMARRNVPLNPVAHLAHRVKGVNPKVAKAAAELSPAFDRFVEFAAKELLPLCQRVCIACCKTSNDDNLSRGGLSFVSIDALPGRMGEVVDGRDAPVPDGDAEPDGGARGAWPNGGMVSLDSKGSAEGCTRLPLSVESQIKSLLSAFKELSILQKCMLLLRWDEMSFVDIGSMSWVPDEMKRHNDKQLVRFWWRQITRKFPLADALSPKRRQGRAESGDGSDADDYRTRSPKTAYLEQELDFGGSS